MPHIMALYFVFFISLLLNCKDLRAFPLWKTPYTLPVGDSFVPSLFLLTFLCVRYSPCMGGPNVTAGGVILLCRHHTNIDTLVTM